MKILRKARLTWTNNPFEQIRRSLLLLAASLSVGRAGIFYPTLRSGRRDHSANGSVGHLSHARGAGHRGPLPLEQDRTTVVGLEHPSELGHERTIGPLPREVGRAVADREAPCGAPLGQQEAAPFDAGV